jgi:predicted phage terminase large subunit-like protein
MTKSSNTTLDYDLQIEIRPQPRQETFLSSEADICIYGGAAFGGKTYALLIEPLRHTDNPKFGAVILRRTIAEITKEGGLWDEASNIYPLLDAIPNKNEHLFTFPSGSKISFGHLQYENDKYSWKSAQIALLEFDQLEMFTESQFFYMLSRNRSASGVAPYVRATCNPEPGWLARFLDWWIDKDGYAIENRSGVIRWMVRHNNVIHWADDKKDLKKQFPDLLPKSVTFILATIYDNKIGMSNDPGYLANLQALSLVDRERLLGDRQRGGNWKIKPSAGKVFNRDWFQIVDSVPFGMRYVRFWDLAATEKKIGKGDNDPDFTASVKMGKHGRDYYIVHAYAEQINPAATDELIKSFAEIDGKKDCRVRWEQEGGASGKRDSYHLTTMLSGWDAYGKPPAGDKITRSKPLAAQARAGNVKILRGAWNEEFLENLHGFPDLPHDDITDAASGAFDDIENGGGSGEYSGDY